MTALPSKPRFRTGRVAKPRPIRNDPTRIMPQWWRDLIRETLVDRRMSQLDLAIAVNVSASQLNIVLAGRGGIARAAVISIARYLAIPPPVFVAESYAQALAFEALIAGRRVQTAAFQEVVTPRKQAA